MSGSGKEHVCAHCQRSFARAEHLERHRRTHTNEKPYTCDTCGERFARVDLRRRHVLLRHADETSAPPEERQENADARSSRKRQRTKKACDRCNTKKLRCEDERPCGSCRSKGLSCISTPIDEDDHASPFDILSDQGLPPHPLQRTPQGQSYDCLDQPFAYAGLAPTATMAGGSAVPAGLSDAGRALQVDGGDMHGSGADVNAGTLEEMDWHHFLEFCQGPPNLDDLLNIGDLTPGLLDSDTTGFSFSQAHLSAPPLGQRTDVHIRFEDLADANLSRPASPRTVQAKERWFRQDELFTRGIPVIEDQELVDELIWLFEDNVAPFFAVFREQEIHIGPATRIEWWLLMAAVGALFSQIKGGTEVAKWLYHIGRQHLLCSASVVLNVPDEQEAPVLMESFILLELFGYLCDDKRIYELIEVPHLQLVQMAQSAGVYNNTGHIEPSKRYALREALLVLESYRIVLLQRPPGISLRNLAPLEPVGSASTQHSMLEELCRYYLPGPYSFRHGETGRSLDTLCALSILTWIVVPNASDDAAQSTWPTNAVENALHRWRAVQGKDADANLAMLFHATNLSMFVRLSEVQNMAATRLKAYKTAKPFDRSSSAGPGATDTALFNPFPDETKRVKGKWHARQIIAAARVLQHGASYSVGSASVTGRSGPNDSDGCKGLRAAPHYAHCVAFASLTLWASSAKEGTLTSLQASKDHLLDGVRLLGGSVASSNIQTSFRDIMLDLLQSST